MSGTSRTLEKWLIDCQLSLTTFKFQGCQALLKRCTIHSRSNVALKGYFPLKIANSAIFYEGLDHISTTLDIQCLTILSINTKVIAEVYATFATIRINTTFKGD